MIDLGYIDPHCPVDWSHPLNIGRVAWWLALPNPGWMGGNLFRDIVRGGKKPNDGTLTSMAIPGTLTSGWGPTVRPGGWGEMRFDGLNDRVQVTDHTSYKPTGAMTIAGWFYIIAAEVNGSGFGTMGFSGTRGFMLSSNNTVIGLYIAPTSTSVQSATVAHTVNRWVRYLGVYAPSESLTLYADGKQVAQNTTSITSSQYQGNGNGLQIGNRGDGNTSADLTGMMDDISIWSRALSPAEVWADYQLSQQGYPGVLNRWGMVARDYTPISVPVFGGHVVRGSGPPVFGGHVVRRV